MAAPRTMFEKIWDRACILTRDDGQSLLYVDRHLAHEGSGRGFARLRAEGRKLRRPDLTFGTADHYVSTKGPKLDDIADPDMRERVAGCAPNAEEFGVTFFTLGDPRRGIVHVVGPEQGLTQPGLLIVCGDSHTSTHGALGAFAFSIGSTEHYHVMATQCLWQRKPRTMRINVEGERGFGVTAKDVILHIIGEIGAQGATGHAIEYAGSTIRGMSIEERLTVCNMSIEAGGRAGMIAPDETTFEYLKGRPFAPHGADWKTAVALWKTLPTDAGAVFDREVIIDAAGIAPTVTWGTSPENALPVTGMVPDPSAEADAGKRTALENAIDYMGLTPGAPLTELTVDGVFIGSCTNGRLSDLRAAAAVAKGRKAKTQTIVVPGSGQVKAQAEAEGLDEIFTEAGMEWREAGCSMCCGFNGDIGKPQQRWASTSNRNFVGRQGPGVRTHLMSAAMAAAAAVTGKFTDVRELEENA